MESLADVDFTRGLSGAYQKHPERADFSPPDEVSRFSALGGGTVTLSGADGQVAILSSNLLSDDRFVIGRLPVQVRKACSAQRCRVASFAF
jgi:hypothetical protein